MCCLEKEGTASFKAEHNAQLTKNTFSFFKFTVEEKHIVFENNEEERKKNTSASLYGGNSKGNNKEDEFKKVFFDKNFFFLLMIKLANSISSFRSWISMLQKDITQRKSNVI